MSAYYPTQGSAYAAAPQPVMYTTSSQGYQPQYASSSAYYGQPAQEGPVIVVPSSHHSHHSHRSRRSHHGHHGYSHSSAMVGTAAAPIVVQPSYAGDYGHHHYHVSFGERIRRFFGLAPHGPFKYRYNRGTWGFMGYSRRQRYSDPRTGAEVDRKGRPIYRV